MDGRQLKAMLINQAVTSLFEITYINNNKRQVLNACRFIAEAILKDCGLETYSTDETPEE